MEKVERIGVSIDKKLLKKFDNIIKSKGYPNRSEAIRDLIRDKISQEKLTSPKINAVASICLVYDHHSTTLMQKLLDLQHSHLIHTISSMHIHLDHHHCMEIIVLKGQAAEIRKMADKITSFRDVKLGRINMIPSDEL